MLKSITFRLKAFRISYLLVSLALAGGCIWLLGSEIVKGFREGLSFHAAVGLFGLVAVLLFESGILSFIVRSLRSGQTLMLKHLVFKADGTPYIFGLVLAAVGTALTLGFGLLILFAGILPTLEHSPRMLIGDILVTLGTNLLFSVLYFFTFRHESGTFQLI